MKRGRPRKAGPRNAKGRLIIVHDKGTEHAQIVPAVLKEGEELLALRRTRLQPMPAERFLPAPAPWHPTQDELDALKADLAGKLKAKA